MGLRYIHIRDKDAKGNDLLTGGITVGYRFLENYDVELSFSQCHSDYMAADGVYYQGDHYNKKIGRAIVTGRMANGYSHIITLKAGEKVIPTLVAWVEEFVKPKYEEEV